MYRTNCPGEPDSLDPDQLPPRSFCRLERNGIFELFRLPLGECLLEPFLEYIGQGLLLFFGEGSSPAYFLACLFEYPVFVYDGWRD